VRWIRHAAAGVSPSPQGRGLEFGFSFSFDAEKDGGFERVIAFYAVLVAVDFS